MATLHERRHLPKLPRDTAFRSRVLLVELESQAVFTISSSFADYARLRCNRAQPCEHCNMRGDAASCSYTTTAEQHTTIGLDSGTKPQHTEDQLHCLEQLVAEAIKLHQGKTQSPVRSFVPFITKHQ